MIDTIQIIFDVLGIISCVALAAYTGETGYVIATIWAVNALMSHVKHIND